MIDYDKVIHGLIDPLVEHPDAVLIRVEPDSNDRDAYILIVAADNSNLRIHLKFESFSEDEKEKGKENDAE